MWRRGASLSKSIVIITLSLAILSCDVFLFPHEGRWNPLDPDNELVEVNGLTLPAARDGYVSDMDERYFGDPILISDRNGAPQYDILIQFDTTDLPEFLNSAKLELYATKASDLDSADVYLIEESWDENTVTWGQISSPSFVDTMIPVLPFFRCKGDVDGEGLERKHSYNQEQDSGPENHSSRHPNLRIIHGSLCHRRS